MCGIAGLFDLTGRRDIDPGLLVRMTDAVAHRGPDGAGYHRAPGIGLGHRRLSVIDLAGGRQPMFNEDRSVVVTFNGEIYNYRDLHSDLVARGHRFATASDTEVIVHGWEEWGNRVVDHLDGMFAFALHDTRRETLFLARDRVGKKPLYWTRLGSGLLLFGSEIQVLTRHPDVRRVLDPQAVDAFFAYGYVPDPLSIFTGIEKLPAAHTLTVTRGRPLPPPREYWRPRFAGRGAPPVDEREAAETLIDLFGRSVERRMIADVPLGAFLSGGVDSSGVVALMARSSPEPIDGFSIAFGGAAKAADETPHARAVAARYGMRHRVERVDPDALVLLDRLAAAYGEPFGDSSALPTYRLSALARGAVTVALSGDGGDEVFAGYRRYLWHGRETRVRQAMPNGLRRTLFGVLGRHYPKLDWAPRPLRARTTFRELAMEGPEAYFAAVSVADDALRHRLFSPRLRSLLDGSHPGEIVARHLAAADTDDPVAAAQYADMRTWLPGRMLVKVDRAAMAHGLEVRCPLLDHHLIDWAASLPGDLRLRGREGKYLLKRALEPLVPHAALYRPKQGFSLPLARWFRGPLGDRVEAMVDARSVLDHDLFDRRFVRTLVGHHRSGRRDHAPVLWLLLAFGAFLERSDTDPAAGRASSLAGIAAV